MSQSFEDLSIERKKLQEEGLVPEWYTTQAWQMFKAKYAVAGEKGVRGRHETIAKTLAAYMPNSLVWEERFFTLLWKGWLSAATPVLANTGTDRGLSVSCSGQYIGDSVDAFYRARHEAAMLSKYGFGCSGYFGDIRPRGAAISKGGQASGPVPVIGGFATDASEISQGSQRRGSFASYMPIDHDDFYEMASKLLAEPDGLNIGWSVRDAFTNRLRTGTDDDAEDRFVESLYTKLVVGKGYFFFPDKANRHRPQVYKDLGLDIKASNLCSEIMLHSSESLTYSCVLSSMNIYKYDEWKDTEAVFWSTVFLDCVVSDFLEKSKGIPGMEKVRKFTEKGRAIGLGVLGFSSYLQKNRIPFESLDAHFLNIEIFKKLHDDSLRATEWMAEVLGEPEWLRGYGQRNTHRTALAPTKSTSLLMGGMSESVFPDPGMVFEQGSAAGGMFRIVPEMHKIMVERGVYNKETLDDIVAHIGSVQHVTWLTDHEKDVFKTAFEVDQFVILRYASVRQPFICQGQSLNFFVSEDGDEERIAALHREAFLDENILSLYYIYSRSGVIVSSVCSACEA